ncbi:MBOAT-domain-containing protein [Ramaria rubella]|nr:MBOAT-domain-containing protein [Ramaria rubella]
MPTDLRNEARTTPLHLQLEEEKESQWSSSWRKRGITSLTVETPTRTRFTADEPLPKARWRTPEFILYALVFAVAIPMMVRVPMRLSSESHPNFPIFARRLSPGWIPGRLVDNSDSQYRSFRNNLIPLSFLASAFFFLSYIYDRATRSSSLTSTPNKLRRIPFFVLFSITMILFLHGFGALKVIFIILINFLIAKLACSPISPAYLGPLITWTFNLLVLYLNEINGGYKFSQLHSSLAMLDTINGFYPRWHVTFNITMLRLVSFNMDYYWTSHNYHRPTEDPATPLTTKQRPRTSHALETYNVANYIAYVLYPPLYIAGPILTFNDFFWQLHQPPSPNNSSTSKASIISYLARFLLCLLTMELILHYMYVVAIKDTSAWLSDSPMELCMIGFWNLIIVWLKLLVFWRFFRLWALMDGIDPPENMVRCMANNYSTLGFWRSWHRSYNLWLARYIYIPVGGANRGILATLLVFTFVALWHDLSFRLLTWGWLVSLFIVPELTARWYFNPGKYGERWWFRHLCALGAIFNILAMMSANLIGFVLGTEGMKYMIQQLFDGWQGILFLFLACVCLFAGVQVMFEYREEERRRGVQRRY